MPNCLPSLAGLSLTCQPCAATGKVVQYDGEDDLVNEGGRHFATYPLDNKSDAELVPGCVICQDPFEGGRDRDGEEIFILESCGHTFHLKCIKSLAKVMLNASKPILCPLCRSELSDKEQVEVGYKKPAVEWKGRGFPTHEQLEAAGNVEYFPHPILMALNFELLVQLNDHIVWETDDELENFKRHVSERRPGFAEGSMDTLMNFFEAGNFQGFVRTWVIRTQIINNAVSITDQQSFTFAEGIIRAPTSWGAVFTHGRRGRGTMTYRPVSYEGLSYIERMLKLYSEAVGSVFESTGPDIAHEIRELTLVRGRAKILYKIFDETSNGLPSLPGLPWFTRQQPMALNIQKLSLKASTKEEFIEFLGGAQRVEELKKLSQWFNYLMAAWS